MPPSPAIYNLFPLLAGPFPDWTPHLQRAKAMGFNWLYFNPVSYPGFSGSLYAVSDYYGFHPILEAHGREQAQREFQQVLAQMAELGLQPMMDLVINHTAIDSPLTREHPDWYLRDEAGKIVHPGAMHGAKKVTWGDLATIDNQDSPARDDLWAFWDRLIAHHQQLGVKGFRCDAAYQVPTGLWSHLIGRARQRDPACHFFAETLGCPIEDVIALAEAGFSHTFNSAKWWDFNEDWCLTQYEQTRKLAATIGFAESHDTPRLAAQKHGDFSAVLARYAFTAMFSSGHMMPMGFEFGATAPLNVVHTRPDEWQQPTDLTAAIGEVNAVAAAHPPLHGEGEIARLKDPARGVTALEKRADNGQTALLLIRRSLAHPAPEAEKVPGWQDARQVTPGCLLDLGAPLRVYLQP